jgi:hypothetical protein
MFQGISWDVHRWLSGIPSSRRGSGDWKDETGNLALRQESKAVVHDYCDCRWPIPYPAETQHIQPLKGYAVAEDVGSVTIW